MVFANSGSGSVSLLSVLLLLFSGVSLTRRLQRMYQDAWRLAPLPGVRRSLNAASGLAALLVEISLLYLIGTLVRSLPFAWSFGFPLSAVAGLLLWTSVPYLLLDRRVPWRRLLPGGALVGLCSGLYGFATTLYMPRLMQTYNERYGLFGVTIALVSWLLCIALIVVAATVVAAEFDRSPERWAQRLRVRLHLAPQQLLDAEARQE
jgi:membrane protein